MSSQPFKIDDIVEFIEDPAFTGPQRVINIWWVSVGSKRQKGTGWRPGDGPHWQVETVWQQPSGRWHSETVDAAELRHYAAVSAAEARSLRICEQTLARRSQQPPAEPLTEASYARAMGVTEGGTPSGDLWREWEGLDPQIAEADEKADRESAGVSALYEARSDELLAPILHRMNEIEAQIAAIVPATVQDCMVQIRLLKTNLKSYAPGEREHLIIDNLLAGLEAMAGTELDGPAVSGHRNKGENER